MKYYKKSETIEAFQMNTARRLNNRNWPQWLHKAWQKDPEEVGSVYPEKFPNSNGDDRLKIHVLEGVHLIVEWGDYIVHNVNKEAGLIYPVEENIFLQTYGPISLDEEAKSGVLNTSVLIENPTPFVS